MSPALWSKLLPKGCLAVESELRPDDLVDLHWPESKVVEHCHPNRRTDFAGGRRCAHAALGDLRSDVANLGRLPHGGPDWPPGVVGSITHCQGLQVACVGSTDVLGALGVDAELDRPLPHGVLRAVAGRDEVAFLQATRALFPCNPDVLLFSIKESLYKAWCGLGHDHADADAVQVFPTVDGSATLKLDEPAARSLEVRWAVRAGYVLTAVASPGLLQRHLHWAQGAARTLAPPLARSRTSTFD